MLPVTVQKAMYNPAGLPLAPCTFLNLPEDAIHHILFHLGVESTRDCSLVCRHLSEITRKDGLWQKLYFRDFYYQPKQNKSQSFLQAYQECHPTEFNLKKGRFTWKTVAELSYFGYGRTSRFCMSNTTLCIDDANNGIKVQDLATNTQFSLPIAPQGWCDSNMMAIHKNHLFSARGNCTVDIYDLETKKHLETLGIPNMGFVGFTLCDNRLIINNLILNRDKGCEGILIWDIEAKKISHSIKLLSGHSISRMAAFQNKLFLGTWTGQILVSDIETNSVRVLPTGKDLVNRLIISENKLIAAHEKGLITIWDIDTEEHLLTLGGEDQERSDVTSLVGANGKLFSSHSNHSIKIWNMQTGECLSTLSTHGSDQIYVMDNKIFSGSFSDRKIKVCDFSESHNAILANAAELFREGDHEVRIAMAQFNALPTDLKNSVYGELYEILKPFMSDYWGCGEDAFHGLFGLNSTRQQKAQAIENYLAKHASS